jgi:hypothetical protein
MTDARLGGLRREALVADAGQVNLSGIVREALVAGIGLTTTIETQSAASITSTATLLTVDLDTGSYTQSSISGDLYKEIQLSANIHGKSGVSGSSLPPTLTSKLNSYVVLETNDIELAKTNSYAVLTSLDFDLSKLITYVVINVRLSVDVSKFEGYAVLKPPPSEDLSKVEGYAVLGPPPEETLSKINAYVVLNHPIVSVGGLGLRPYFAVSSA